MGKVKSLFRSETFFSNFLLILVSALVYLPLLGSIGYSNDDWYLMYAGQVAGPGIFQAIFSIDRPLRAFVLGPAYLLFGGNVLLYNLSAWFFRVASALLLMWMLRMLWPGRPKAIFAMGLLYVLYPGFLSQFNGIDYQSQMISLAAAMLSLGLTVRAFSETRRALKMTWIGLAILLGWIYLGLVEYEAGFEFLRLGVLFILVARETRGLRPQLVKTLRAWWPYALVPLVFGFWRVFIFHTERKATNLGSQVQGLLSAPLHTILDWASRLILDSFNSLVSAWGVPLYQISARVTALDVLIGTALGLLAVAAVLFASARLFPLEDPAPETGHDWRVEAIWLGLSTVAVALVPVILANRQVSFPDYSRYTLVGSVGVAMVVVAGLFSLAGKKLQSALFSCLLLLACMTQYTNGALFAQESASMRAFWWQVAWRIPQLERNTTLMAHYPLVSIQEDYFVWGPANMIYYPEKLPGDSVQPGIYAAVPNDDAVRKVLIRQRQEYDKRRTILTYANYRNILILSQPTTDSCVQVIDGAQPELSTFESSNFIAMAPHSEIEHILLDEDFKTPPAAVFGAEPAHDWCYFYEKAAFARQRGDWQAVAALGDTALNRQLSPADPIEWMPFLQAYAALGNTQRVAEIGSRWASEPFAQAQACSSLGKMSGLSPEIQEQVKTLFCAVLQ